MKNNTERSKYLAFLLRHDPGSANLVIEENGWISVSDLTKNTDFTVQELLDIVSADKKCRYSFNTEGTKIRANQGHSVDVVMHFKEFIPTGRLFHGTQMHNFDSIMRHGLHPMSRQYVHLSQDKATAEIVSERRKGEHITLLIDAERMHKDGHKFFISENNVILVATVPADYISLYAG